MADSYTLIYCTFKPSSTANVKIKLTGPDQTSSANRIPWPHCLPMHHFKDIPYYTPRTVHLKNSLGLAPKVILTMLLGNDFSSPLLCFHTGELIFQLCYTTNLDKHTGPFTVFNRVHKTDIHILKLLSCDMHITTATSFILQAKSALTYITNIEFHLELKCLNDVPQWKMNGKSSYNECLKDMLSSKKIMQSTYRSNLHKKR